MNATPDEHRYPLSDTHRMLLRMRDVLYEGSWDDFLHDLRCRAEGRPHVFETVPTCPEMTATIGEHMALIRDMQGWEAELGRPLSPDE